MSGSGEGGLVAPKSEWATRSIFVSGPAMPQRARLFSRLNLRLKRGIVQRLAGLVAAA